MMINKNLFLAILCSCLFLNQLSAQWWKNTDEIEGNGESVTNERKTSDYDAVSLTGFMDVQLVKGTEGAISVKAESNLQQYILTEVKGETLQISVKEGYQLDPSEDILITVPFTDLNKVSLTGSGDIQTSQTIQSQNFTTQITGSGNISLGLEAQNARASITGSGDIHLEGSADDFDCEVTGSGDISAFDLKCERVEAKITGSGDIEVFASEELRASVPGAGDISYKGNPKLEDLKTSGVGSIRKQ